MRSDDLLSLKEFRQLAEKWLGTLSPEAEWWDGIQCSDRDMGEKYVLGPDPFIKSLFEFLEESLKEELN